MASPNAKYSNNASNVTSATTSASRAVDAHKTIPTANGINTPAVATRFQAIVVDSPKKSRPSSHHIERNKSRRRSGTDIPVCPNQGIVGGARPARPELQGASDAALERRGNQRRTEC